MRNKKVMYNSMHIRIQIIYNGYDSKKLLLIGVDGILGKRTPTGWLNMPYFAGGFTDCIWVCLHIWYPEILDFHFQGAESSA